MSVRGTEENIYPGLVVKGRFRIESCLGRGGFGVVWAARDLELDTELALKFLHPDLIATDAGFHRVRREINLARKISHPGIVKIYSLEEWNGTRFLVMEKLEGKSLAEVFSEKGKMEWSELCPLFMQILAGVKALHSQKIIHRDLKPRNIFILKNREVRILDFGLAKEISDNFRTSKLGEIIGSPMYMSPEQIMGKKPGFASDIYQLGLILFEALSGRLPLNEETSTMELLMRKVRAPLPDSGKISRGLPGFLRDAINRCLERNPKKRFPSVNRLEQKLTGGRALLCYRVRRIFTLPRMLAAGFLLTAFIVFGPVKRILNRVDRIEYTDEKVHTSNILGHELWHKRFSGFKVNWAFEMLGTGKRFWNWNHAGGKPDPIGVILENPANQVFSPHESLGSTQADHWVLVLDSRNGSELSRDTLGHFFQVSAYHFTRRFRISGFKSEDIGWDSNEEQVLLLRQSQGMYPTALVVYSKRGLLTFSNPGIIDYYTGAGRGADRRLLVVGKNNIMGHFRFFTELEFADRGEFHLAGNVIFGLPHLENENTYYNASMMVFLPHYLQIREKKMTTAGYLRGLDVHTQEEIKLHRSGRLEINGVRGRRVIFDNRNDLVKLMEAVNLGYRSRMISKDFDQARAHFLRARSFPVKNPYLRSAVDYMAADLELAAGNYAAVRRHAESALQHYAYAEDAACCLCSAELLAGFPQRAYDLAEKRLGWAVQFWGLSQGKRIFQLYCLLLQGEFLRAEKFMVPMLCYKEISKIFSGMLDCFRGHYAAAHRKLSDLKAKRFSTFTRAEFRAMYMRTALLSNSEPDRVRFFSKDLYKNSVYHSWQGAMTYAYTEAEQGHLAAARKLAARAFENLQKGIRGSVDLRLWWFYDAYVYGKIMEKTGNRTEALRGYRSCISACPASHLAGLARRRLAAL